MRTVLLSKKNFEVATETRLCFFLLIGIPIVAWLAEWQWTPDMNKSMVQFFYFITCTASVPYAILNSILILAWIIWTIKPERKILTCCLLLILPLGVGQISVSMIKLYFKEPRPYSIWLENVATHKKLKFYASNQPNGVGVEELEEYQNDSEIPIWQKEHWANERTWSFPSGHSFFASMWAFLVVGLFCKRKKYVACLLFISWAWCVITSRLVLGMHWPSDLLFSICLAFILSQPSVNIINKIIIAK